MSIQTFLPYPDFRLVAQVLDDQRLGNQVYRECKTLIQGGWPNHPASKMWQGYQSALASYSLELLRELTRRGRHYPHHYEFFEQFIADDTMPPWLGDERLHSSHRAALLWKDPVHYEQFGWTEEMSCPPHPYFWPVT